ncbi:MAG: pyridoxamine 5'-phosphate oxidase, partial [Gemmatimonadetes bacterium]|nr:pyridoxamine 5'-phosphate oxidase [Gemmatimonadota bacterium]
MSYADTAPAADAAIDPRVDMRRKDRGKDDAWIRAYLHAATWGFVGVVGEDGQPYVHSNLFAFDEERHCLWIHGYRAGRLRSCVKACARVAFSAAGMGRMLPATTSLGFSVEYASVVVYGTAHVVEGAGEATHGLRMLMEKYAPHLRYGEDYQGIPAEDLERTAVYRVDIEAWSGKQKEAAEDFPGAYTLPE